MIKIHGRLVDGQTRCIHYHTVLDIVAIQFKCCERYYACYLCHEELESHDAVRWVTADLGRHALFCGVCTSTLAIADYLSCGFACVSCRSPFNPGCARHRELYFNLWPRLVRASADTRNSSALRDLRAWSGLA